MSKITNAIDELLLELRDQNKIEQTDVRDISKEIRERISKLKEEKQEKPKAIKEMEEAGKISTEAQKIENRYFFQGVGK